MKKRKPARLYPEKEDITIQNFLLEDKNLLIETELEKLSKSIQVFSLMEGLNYEKQ